MRTVNAYHPGPDADAMTRLDPATLESFAAEVTRAIGAPDETASAVASSLVTNAELPVIVVPDEREG